MLIILLIDTKKARNEIHNHITFSLPAKKGKKGAFDQGLRYYEIIEPKRTVKVAAGTFKNVVVVKITEPANHFNANYFVAPNRGIILENNGKETFSELHKYSK